MRTPHRYSREAGMTLIEVLVVVIIISLVSGFLFQSLANIYDMRRRFGVWIDGAGEQAVAVSWVRDTIQGTVAEYEEGTHPFRGTPESVLFLSVAGLTQRPGVPALVEWRVRYDQKTGESNLEYREWDAPWRALLHWTGRSGGFRYGAADGQQYDQWPPPLTGPWPQLPNIVRFYYGGSIGAAQEIVAAIPSLKDPDRLITQVMQR